MGIMKLTDRLDRESLREWMVRVMRRLDFNDVIIDEDDINNDNYAH